MSLAPQIFIHIPYTRLVVYLFTIAFHSFLMIKAAIKGQEILILLLLIPIVAVTLGLYRYAKSTVIKLAFSEKDIIINTFLKTQKYNFDDIELAQVNQRYKLISTTHQVYNLQPMLKKGRATEILNYFS